jgi:isopenicillin-N N-acyltransferase-like protein
MIFRLFVVALIVAQTVQLAYGAYCHGKPADGERTNDFDVVDTELTFVKSVENAMVFEAGPANARFPVVHLWGTPYEMGFAQGTIRKEEIRKFVTETWAYLNSELLEALSGDRLPQWLKEMIVEKGMERALDWSWRTTEDFTPKAYFDEVHGIADATGMDFNLLYRLNMFPELSKAQCSFFGAWGTASKEGHAYQLRALDFDTTGPFKDWPQVTVYHPNEGHAWGQVGWPGNIGVLTGFSDQQLAISEIGVAFPDETFGQGMVPDTPPEKVHGEPWMYILRDVLQYEDSLTGAQNRITNANRTCNLIIGVGDGEMGKSNGVQFSGYVANFYEDFNLLPVNETWHVPIENVVYNGMDWLCPGYNQVLGDQLRKYHGSIDELVTMKNILPTAETGSLHIAVYDLTEQNMHVSFSRSAAADPSEPFNAYERQYTRLRMKDMFAQQKPVV